MSDQRPNLPPIFSRIHPEKLRERLERFHASANLPPEEREKVWQQLRWEANNDPEPLSPPKKNSGPAR